MGALVDYCAQFKHLPCGFSKMHLFLESEIIYVYITRKKLKEYAYLVCSHANVYQDSLSKLGDKVLVRPERKVEEKT